jgi:serine protease Do
MFMGVVFPIFSQQSLSKKDLKGLQQVSDAYKKLTQYVSPAVVQIFVTSYAPGSGLTSGSLLYKQRGGGSGVVVNPKGFIVTNLHVVEDAISLKVRLTGDFNDTSTYQSILKPEDRLLNAKIIGVDRETDLAVIKIDSTNLPFMPFGDSDILQNGELVFAFGSPLGLPNSVTMGIVSSVARQLRPEDPMIYIQTDTPINPGNSGGPLVNTKGEIIGINTLIFTQSGGSEGIGFAAPSNIVKTVYEQIIKYGYVRRGFIGVKPQTISPIMAKGLKLPVNHGVILADVFPNGSAYKAGLSAGDIVLSLNGKKMENGRQFEVNIYQKGVNEVIELEILRKGERKKFWVSVQQNLEEEKPFIGLEEPNQNLIPQLGILVINVTEELRGTLPGIRRENGIIVVARAVDAPYWDIGLLPGDVIYSINRQIFKDLSDLQQILSGYQTGDAIVLEIQRRKEIIYVAFEME